MQDVAEVSEEPDTLEGAAEEHLPCSSPSTTDEDHDNVLPKIHDTGADNAVEDMNVLNTFDASEEQGERLHLPLKPASKWCQSIGKEGSARAPHSKEKIVVALA